MIEKRLLLTKEAAELLRISEEYLRCLIRQKKIPAYKEGRRGGYRISSKEIDNYIARRYSERAVE
ncbi:MAG: helix-turn-helix domain-containing protein [Candidatus Omnitrophica bacterium]|nr:helix-turn-helix domain-containing protein [Candidatus Omnitrophota bacterium]